MTEVDLLSEINRKSDRIHPDQPGHVDVITTTTSEHYGGKRMRADELVSDLRKPWILHTEAYTD